MRSAFVGALCCVISALPSRQGESPVGTYKLTFQPRSEVVTATLTIARRDSGYRATISFLVHFDDGDMRGPLTVERVKPKGAP